MTALAPLCACGHSFEKHQNRQGNGIRCTGVTTAAGSCRCIMWTYYGADEPPAEPTDRYEDLIAEVARQDIRHPGFPATRDGLRLAIAAAPCHHGNPRNACRDCSTRRR